MKRLPRVVARFAALAVALMALLMPAGTARADTAAAQALFDEAKKLMAAGKFAEACPKLEESQRLDPGIGTQFNLATCYERIGKTASAWSLYLDVAGSAKALNQAEREKVARKKAEALEASLARLTITVEKPAPGQEVKRDGVTVGQAQWGTAVPIDPGEHALSSWAPGRTLWESKITVEKKSASLTVNVPELAAAAMPPPGFTPAPAGARYYPEPEKPKTKRRSGGMIAGGIVAMSLGVIGALVGGTVVGACTTLSCRNKEAGVGLLVGGLALAGGGIALTVVGATKVPVARTTAMQAPVLVMGPGSAELRFTF